MKIECPNCGRIGNLPSGKALPSVVRCPGCKTKFEPSEYPLAPVPVKQPQAEPIYVVQPVQERPERQLAPSISQVVHVNMAEPTKGNALAIAALTVGILAAMICWIPLLGLVAIPVGAVGILLAVPAIVLAFALKRSGKAASITGFVFSIVAIMVSFAITDSVAKTFRRDLKEELAANTVAAKPVPARPEAKDVDQEAKPTPAPIPVPKAEPKKQAEPEDTRIAVPAYGRLEDVEVRVGSADITIVKLKELFGDNERTSKNPQLIITIEIVNRGPNRKINFHSWDNENSFLSSKDVSLEDNFGNRYKMVSFGSTTTPVGRTSAGSIYPGKSIIDVLVFEPPIDTATYLDLDLKGDNADVKGVFKFRMPTAMIRR